VFFGGGTPSLMAPSTVEAILNEIARHWTVAKDVEVTLEANPTSVEASRFRSFKAAGVNRVSLAFRRSTISTLKSRTSAFVAEALAALSIANSVFQRTSFDLIYAA